MNQEPDKSDKTIGDLSKEEQEKYFEAHLSPLIRYGFSEAISELLEWVKGYDDQYLPLLNKLTEMTETKRQVNWEKLKLEVESPPQEPDQAELWNEVYSTIVCFDPDEVGLRRAFKALGKEYILKRKE